MDALHCRRCVMDGGHSDSFAEAGGVDSFGASAGVGAAVDGPDSGRSTTTKSSFSTSSSSSTSSSPGDGSSALARRSVKGGGRGARRTVNVGMGAEALLHRLEALDALGSLWLLLRVDEAAERGLECLAAGAVGHAAEAGAVPVDLASLGVCGPNG